MFYKENGVIYVIEDNKVVASMNKDSYYGTCPSCGKTEYDIEKNATCDECGTEIETKSPSKKKKNKKKTSFKINEKVSSSQGEGTIISMVPNIYGESIGVKFDDGKYGEFFADDLEKVESSNENMSLVDEYNEYNSMPAMTLKEIERKSKVARSLNLRAKTLLSQNSLSLSERVDLDAIATATGADLTILKETKNNVQLSDGQNYLDKLPKFKVSDSFGGWGSLAKGGSEDMSWIGSIDIDPVDWDKEITSIARDAVDKTSRENLESDNFMEDVYNFAKITVPEDYHDKLSKYISIARELKLSETPVVTKEASVDLSNIPFEGCFL